MSADVTATKFRPQSFDELIGQDFVATTLKNSIQEKSIANAYLLSGPRGVGKTSAARIIAKALNCINGPTGTPCNKCINCISITQGSNTDVIEIDGASNTSVNDVRVIQEELLYPPVNSHYKVYIIDEVHMLSKSAFNALLKTIEEPPPKVVFIFATTEINKVPQTIRSRCQQFYFRLIPANLIYQNLVIVLSQKKIKYEDIAVKWIANEGKGSMRDSYTLLDQVISFCDYDITIKKIRETLGLVGEDRISKIVSGISNNDRQIVIGGYFEMIEAGISPEQIINEMILFFRNILFKKLNITSKSELLNDEDSHYKEFISIFSIDDLEIIIEILFKSYENSRYSIDLKTEIEVCLFKLMKYKELIKPKQILNELYNLKSAIIDKNINPLLNTKNNSEIYKEVSNNKITIEQAIIEKQPEKSDIIKSLKLKLSPIHSQLVTALDNISGVSEQGSRMTISFSHQLYFDMVKKNEVFLSLEVSKIIGKEFFIEAKYNPDLKKKSQTVGDINLQRVKELFNGTEI